MTGVSSHLLSTRLKSLEQHGLIERRAYRARPPRYEYFVTPKGKELEGILLLLRSWGTKWPARPGETEPAIFLKHKSTGKDVPEDLLKLSFFWKILSEQSVRIFISGSRMARARNTYRALPNLSNI
ncbi:helix-turn-helix transcriptional regulator [Serratia plymuthica]|nr:helix-turn-helix transcriptional regulator [Serratia plymuthica]